MHELAHIAELTHQSLRALLVMPQLRMQHFERDPRLLRGARVGAIQIVCAEEHGAAADADGLLDPIAIAEQASRSQFTGATRWREVEGDRPFTAHRLFGCQGRVDVEIQLIRFDIQGDRDRFVELIERGAQAGRGMYSQIELRDLGVGHGTRRAGPAAPVACNTPYRARMFPARGSRDFNAGTYRTIRRNVGRDRAGSWVCAGRETGRDR